MAFKLPTLRDLPRQITSDLLSFDYEDITDEKPIAKGGFGFVYKATNIKKNGRYQEDYKQIVKR